MKRNRIGEAIALLAVVTISACGRGEEELFSALRAGDAAAVEQALSDATNMGATSDGETLFRAAAGDPEKIGLLVQAGYVPTEQEADDLAEMFSEVWRDGNVATARALAGDLDLDVTELLEEVDFDHTEEQLAILFRVAGDIDLGPYLERYLEGNLRDAVLQLLPHHEVSNWSRYEEQLRGFLRQWYETAGAELVDLGVDPTLMMRIAMQPMHQPLITILLESATAEELNATTVASTIAVDSVRSSSALPDEPGLAMDNDMSTGWRMRGAGRLELRLTEPLEGVTLLVVTVDRETEEPAGPNEVELAVSYGPADDPDESGSFRRRLPLGTGPTIFPVYLSGDLLRFQFRYSGDADLSLKELALYSDATAVGFDTTGASIETQVAGSAQPEGRSAVRHETVVGHGFVAHGSVADGRVAIDLFDSRHEGGVATKIDHIDVAIDEGDAESFTLAAEGTRLFVGIPGAVGDGSSTGQVRRFDLSRLAGGVVEELSPIELPRDFSDARYGRLVAYSHPILVVAARNGVYAEGVALENPGEGADGILGTPSLSARDIDIAGRDIVVLTSAGRVIHFAAGNLPFAIDPPDPVPTVLTQLDDDDVAGARIAATTSGILVAAGESVTLYRYPAAGSELWPTTDLDIGTDVAITGVAGPQPAVVGVRTADGAGRILTFDLDAGSMGRLLSPSQVIELEHPIAEPSSAGRTLVGRADDASTSAPEIVDISPWSDAEEAAIAAAEERLIGGSWVLTSSELPRNDLQVLAGGRYLYTYGLGGLFYDPGRWWIPEPPATPDRFRVAMRQDGRESEVELLEFDAQATGNLPYATRLGLFWDTDSQVADGAIRYVGDEGWEVVTVSGVARTTASLRMRSGPGTDYLAVHYGSPNESPGDDEHRWEPIQTAVPSDTEVTLLARTPSRVTIAGASDYWYYVPIPLYDQWWDVGMSLENGETFDGQRIWLFGGYLER